MLWLIALLVIGMVLAPVMWIMPTPTQRRQTRLRDAARAAGLQVQVGPLPQTRRQRVRKEDTEFGVGYMLRLPRPKRARQAWIVWRQPGDDEAAPELSAAAQAALDTVLEAMPADVVAVEYTAIGLIAHWRERGSEEDVQHIGQLLTQLANAMGVNRDQES